MKIKFLLMLFMVFCISKTSDANEFQLFDHPEKVCFDCPQQQNSDEPMFTIRPDGKSYDVPLSFAVLYYSSPRGTPYTPRTTSNIEGSSDHMIYIGNQVVTKQLADLVEETVKGRKKGSGKPFTLFLQIDLFDKKNKFRFFWLDKNKNFEFGGYPDSEDNIKGKVSQENFDQLIKFCEKYKEVIDLNFQKRQIIEK